MDMLIDSKTVSMPYLRGPIMEPVSLEPSMLNPPIDAASGMPNPRLKSTKLNLSEHQSRALASLTRVVDESSVFAAVTGPVSSGTSDVIIRLLEQSKGGNRVCISIRNPSRINNQDVDQIKQTLFQAIQGAENRSLQVLVGVDHAHTATPELLSMLDFFAQSRNRALSPQVILAGERELWDHLEAPRFKLLRQRFALRLVLPSTADHV